MTLPTWLDARDEITADPPRRPRADAIRLFYGICRTHGLTERQALEVTAHAVTESGGFQHDRGFNPFGWKARRDWAIAYRQRFGHGPQWWQRAGHAASGDPPVCYYRGFSGYDEALLAFLPAFCPRPGTALKNRYARAGEAYWGPDPEHWFIELLAAGYRGDVVAKNPGLSIAEHVKLVAEIRTLSDLPPT